MSEQCGYIGPWTGTLCRNDAVAGKQFCSFHEIDGPIQPQGFTTTGNMPERTYTQAEVDSEIAKLHEPGPCGKHPRMFWKETPQGSALMGTSYTHGEIVSGGHCTLCAELDEKLRLERAVVMQKAGYLFLDWADQAGVRVEESVVRQRLADATSADQSALDGHDVELEGKWLLERNEFGQNAIKCCRKSWNCIPKK